jgi:hypothetical protein
MRPTMSGARRSEEMMMNRVRVKEAFDAKLVASRRRERFDPGELLMVVESPDSPSHSRFMRINGLRPSRGVECQYILAADEFREKTEVFKPTR